MAEKMLVSLLLQKDSSVANAGINRDRRRLYLARIIPPSNILAFQTQPSSVNNTLGAFLSSLLTPNVYWG